jgi:hypothetical protein
MAKHTIKLKNYSDLMEEYVAHAAITPGMLLQLNSDGEIQAHATASGNAFPMFACEDELQGKGIDDAYEAGDVVQVWIPGRGDQVNAIIANGENIHVGDWLSSSSTAGELKKHVPIVDSASDVETILVQSIVGQALEDVDMSNSSGADPSGRCAVRIL